MATLQTTPNTPFSSVTRGKLAQANVRRNGDLRTNAGESGSHNAVNTEQLKHDNEADCKNNEDEGRRGEDQAGKKITSKLLYFLKFVFNL